MAINIIIQAIHLIKRKNIKKINHNLKFILNNNKKM